MKCGRVHTHELVKRVAFTASRALHERKLVPGARPLSTLSSSRPPRDLIAFVDRRLIGASGAAIAS